MTCRIVVALSAVGDALIFRTAEGRWTPLRHEAAAMPADIAQRMAEAIETQDPTIAVAYSLDADCVANRWVVQDGADTALWASRTAAAPAFAPAAAWA